MSVSYAHPRLGTLQTRHPLPTSRVARQVRVAVAAAAAATWRRWMMAFALSTSWRRRCLRTWWIGRGLGDARDSGYGP